ncbi:MAG: radical SAM protein [Sedimentisphaerales bacterium]|nr:radical SAM protein [Sedimentisphaerales bacterium]
MKEDNKKFRRPDICRPPSEQNSYFLPLTAGCSNSTCTFCSYYGNRLRMREHEDVKTEIDALALFVEQGIVLANVDQLVYIIAQHWDRRRIFLQDGDALVYPYPKLIEILEHLNKKFPDIERIGIYATPRDILRRSLEELKELKRLKLNIFYIGIESGDDKVLERIDKGANHNEMVEAGKKAKEAGIILSLTVLLGLGGVEGSHSHVLETARILSEIDPEYVGALTVTLIPGTPLYEQAKRGEFKELTPFEFLAELKGIIENSNFTNCFFSSMHASNYLSVRGTLPTDKERMLSEIQRVLDEGDSSRLRPEFLRGL